MRVLTDLERRLLGGENMYADREIEPSEFLRLQAAIHTLCGFGWMLAATVPHPTRSGEVKVIAETSARGKEALRLDTIARGTKP